MAWTFGSALDIGARSEQQDRLAVLNGIDGKRHLLVLGDGMGGLPDGALAAQTLIDVASRRFASFAGNNGFELLQNICLETHDNLLGLATATSQAPGTTAVLLYLDKTTAHWLHVGDSRLYHFRQGRLLNRTFDHSLLRLMQDKGLELNGNQAIAQSRLYMRLGGANEPEADFNSSKLEDGDVFLLCSDGLWQAFDAEEIQNLLQKNTLTPHRATTLANLARERGGPSCDNISLIVAEWRAGGLLQRFRQAF